MVMKGRLKCMAAVTTVTFALCLLAASQPFALVAVDILVSSQGVAMARLIKGTEGLYQSEIICFHLGIISLKVNY